MLRRDSALNSFILAAAMALAIGYFVPRYLTQTAQNAASGGSSGGSSGATASATNATATEPGTRAPTVTWAASAPGRIEPTGGEIKISPQAGGRIAEVLVGVNDKVQAGDLLVRFDDSDLDARVAAAEAEVNVRRRERDGEQASGKNGQDRRAAEDALAAAERTLASNRGDFDRLVKSLKTGGATPADVDKAREAVTQASQKLGEARTAVRKVNATAGMPLQTRLEAGIAAARAELTLAEAALERTRVRAPRDGTILQVLATQGETAAPSPENVLVIMGDMSKLRVRAEIEERDVGKVRAGQAAVIRSDAYPGKDFEGKIASIAQALGPARMSLKGPRKPTDIDVLEIMIDLNGTPPLLSGMRVDVFLKPDATAAAPAPKSN